MGHPSGRQWADIRPRTLLLPLALLITTVAPAQSGPSDKLHQLAIAAEDLQHHLPAFACTESFVSQEVRNGKVRTPVKGSGDLRVQLGPDGKLAEHFQVTLVNGHPSTKLHVPMFVSGGFQNALGVFQPEVQPCFDFTTSANRIDFTSFPNPTPACKEHSDTTGFAILDTAGNILRLEHRIPVDIARARKAVPFGAIELTRTDLGGATFPLSTHVVADIPGSRPDDKSTYHWEATYTNCHLFAVTIKISPAADTPPGP
jgi:hypothetical protein